MKYIIVYCIYLLTMPAIVLKDYTWRQTEEAVIISVDVPNYPNNADIFAIDNYVKVIKSIIFNLKLCNDDILNIDKLYSVYI